jgi:hypothetical protein
VARKVSTNPVASSCECIRAPTLITFALLCSRPSRAVSSLQASAARTAAAGSLNAAMTASPIVLTMAPSFARMAAPSSA